MQVDIISLVEIQVNPLLTLYIFSIRDRLYCDKKSIPVCNNNKNKLIGSRQKGRVHTSIVRMLTKLVVVVGPNLTGLIR